jgi:hypothetical protein
MQLFSADATIFKKITITLEYEEQGTAARKNIFFLLIEYLESKIVGQSI